MNNIIDEINDIIKRIENLSKPLKKGDITTFLNFGLTKEQAEQLRENQKNEALNNLKNKIKNYIEEMKAEFRLLYNVDKTNLNIIINELEAFIENLESVSIKDLGKNFSSIVTKLNTELAAKETESKNNKARELRSDLIQIDIVKRTLQTQITFAGTFAKKYKVDKSFETLIANFIAKSNALFEKQVDFYTSKQTLDLLQQQRDFFIEKILPRINEKIQSDSKDKKNKSDKLAEINHKKNELKNLIDKLKPMSFIIEIKSFIDASNLLIANADSLNENNSLEDFNKIINELNGKIAYCQKLEKVKTDLERRSKISDLKNIVDSLEDGPLKTELNTLLNPTFPIMELKDAKTNIESTIESGINNFIQNHIASLQELITQYGYTLNNTELNELNKCITIINGQTDLTERLKQTINLLIPTIVKFKQQLLDKSLAESGTDGKLKPKTAANDEIELDEIRAGITKGNFGTLHEQLQALRTKHGSLTPHQQALEMRIGEYVAARTEENNQTINARVANSEVLLTELGLTRYGDTTDRRTHKEARALERQIFKNGLIFWNKSKIKNLIQSRGFIIGEMEKKRKYGTIYFDTSTHNEEYETQLERLRQIDVQLFGEEKVKSIYNALSTRPHSFTLLGGTKLVIPQVLLDMQEKLTAGLDIRERFSK